MGLLSLPDAREISSHYFKVPGWPESSPVTPARRVSGILLARSALAYANVHSSCDVKSAFPAEAWMRTGIASDNPFTVRALAFIIAGHVTHHFNIVRQKYL